MQFSQITSGTYTLKGAKHYTLLFICFFVLPFLIYLPAMHARFVFDFINMVFNIRTRADVTDFSNGILFDFVSRFVFKTWLQIFGFNVWAWHFLQCFLHSVNGILLYALVGFILRHFKYTQPRSVALLVAMCFLFNPYQTEPVVWGGDLNYLLVAVFILINLLAYLFFLQRRQTRYLVIAQLAMVTGAFTHELGWFIFPADVILAAILAPSLPAFFSNQNFKYWAISIVLLACYFANKALSGSMLGHYGSAVHLHFKLAEIVPVFYQYIIKILFLGGFYPAGFLNKLYGHLGRGHVVYVLIVVFLLAMAVFCWLVQKRPALKVPLGLFLLFALFVFPVLNLYFPYWIKIQGDRYCYITSAFLLASCITFLYNLKPSAAFLFGAAYLTGSAFFLAYNIQSWHNAGSISASLESNYRWQNAGHVYILNLPDSYRGAYMYRSLQPSAFAASFIKDTGAMPNGRKITEVLSYNLNSPTDSVNVEATGKEELRVSLSTWGNWWWRDTKGATDYEDSLVAVHPDEYGHTYTVRFKQKQPGDVFLYCASGQWREVQNF